MAGRAVSPLFRRVIEPFQMILTVDLAYGHAARPGRVSITQKTNSHRLSADEVLGPKSSLLLSFGRVEFLTIQDWASFGREAQSGNTLQT
jgi:hypothetical protein